MKYIRTDIQVGDYYYVPVFFWKRKRDFRKATGSDKYADACFMHLNSPLKHYPLLGELHFVRGRFGPGMLAHEVTHVILGMANMLQTIDEEFICETAQVITAGVWTAIWNDKKLKKLVYE